MLRDESETMQTAAAVLTVVEAAVPQRADDSAPPHHRRLVMSERQQALDHTPETHTVYAASVQRIMGKQTGCRRNKSSLYEVMRL